MHAAGLALAGVDWPGDEEVLSEALRAAGMPRRHVVVNDAFAALRAGSPDGVGVVSCAGTGCITAARSPDGRVFRTLAVGYGEWGGSWELAREGVHAVARARHGTGAATALTDRIPQALGLPDADALFRAIARDDYHPEPTLARVVLGAADEGDSVAIQIAAAGGHGLARSAAAAAARLELEAPFLVIRSGGVHRAGCARARRRVRRRRAGPAARLPGAAAAGIAGGGRRPARARPDRPGRAVRPPPPARGGRSMTLMRDEIGQQPEAIARTLEATRPAAAALAADVRRRRCDVVVLVARGTSDHAAIYARYLLEARCGLSRASLRRASTPPIGRRSTSAARS